MTTIWDWLVQLNASNFAGHSDWRIPTFGSLLRPSELETILYYDPACGAQPKPPCVSAAFNNKCDSGGSCTGQEIPLGDVHHHLLAYWSATKWRAGGPVARNVFSAPQAITPLFGGMPATFGRCGTRRDPSTRGAEKTGAMRGGRGDGGRWRDLPRSQRDPESTTVWMVMSRLRVLSTWSVSSAIASSSPHQLMILGEATKRISPAYRAAHPEIPWRLMASTRDTLEHRQSGLLVRGKLLPAHPGDEPLGTSCGMQDIQQGCIVTRHTTALRCREFARDESSLHCAQWPGDSRHPRGAQATRRARRASARGRTASNARLQQR